MPRKAKNSSVLKMAPVVVPVNRQLLQLNKPPNRNAARRKKGKKGNSKAGRRSGLNTMTPNGVAFLQAATAGPDFDIISCQGIPDLYSGKSLVKHNYSNVSFTCIGGNTLTVVVAPTPGVPIWYNQRASSTLPTDLNLQPILPEESSTMFPAMFEMKSSGRYDNTGSVSQFRFIGLQAELINTNNQNTWAGTIFCHKTSNSLTNEEVGDSMKGIITGADGIVSNVDQGGYSNNTNAYANTVNAGVYSCALNNHESFEFHPIRDAQNSDSLTYGFRKEASSSSTGKLIFNGPVLGWGTLDTITFSVIVPVGAVGQTFMCRVWSIVEYTPTPGSLLYEFATNSPAEDHRALAVYKALCANLPVAVPFGENAHFWERVRKLAISATRFFSHLPGPVGTISGAVSELIAMI